MSAIEETANRMRLLTINPVVDNAQRQSMNVTIVGPAHDVRAEELVGLIKWAVIQVDNAQVFSHRFRKLGILHQFPFEGIMRSVFDGAGCNGRLIHVLKVVSKSFRVVDIPSEVCSIASLEDWAGITGSDGNIPCSQVIIDKASEKEDEDNAGGADDGESRVSQLVADHLCIIAL